MNEEEKQWIERIAAQNVLEYFEDAGHRQLDEESFPEAVAQGVVAGIEQYDRLKEDEE